ncbi:DUF3761 domain-containing protein [Flavisolibacter ginsenosidimutans]|uniref:DUF3761 domain-containing protein n=1 Tax=Flavisolibacter ginsenosidimutans TaxID=661481 RepID=A0A5B8UJ55_9BACT|nr:DUF3761 domain-containing protein [Flavisolibacter ginsenosidimutans]QEC56707.1 DUF3761 domain-containing protein [Flavisolibacter ginsenosidimutans]
MFPKIQAACTSRFFFLIALILISCNTHTASPGNPETELQTLKLQLSGLQKRVDSLIAVLEQRQPEHTKKVKASKQAKANISATTTQATSAYNWQSVNTNAPALKETREQRAYRVRTGAICNDGSRSYATGRGACSHHGGVREWLY